MPTIFTSPAPNLTLTTTGSTTRVRVQYSVYFSALERFLAGNGLTFREIIQVMGIDPPGSTTGIVLAVFPVQNIPVPAGTGAVTVARDRSDLEVPRNALQEDPIGDSDEIRCKIIIQPIGLPAEVSAFTDQEILLG
jgi:hypothetical protein